MQVGMAAELRLEFLGAAANRGDHCVATRENGFADVLAETTRSPSNDPDFVRLCHSFFDSVVISNEVTLTPIALLCSQQWLITAIHKLNDRF